MPVPRLIKAFAGDREIDKIFGQNQTIYSAGPPPIFDYFVNFEDATKTAYGSGTVNLNGINWDMTEVLIGTASEDWKEDAKSARLRGYAASIMSMLADKTDGIGQISFLYRRYGTDATQIPWLVDYSLDSGSNWTNAGTFTATADVQTFSATVNQVSNNVRVRIRANTGLANANRRANVDNILITGYRG
jgi:hypothetical protein